MLISYEGRQIQIDGIHGAEDDIQIDGAFYVDTGDYVEDDVIDWIYENCGDSLYEAWFEKQVARADFMDND